MFIVPQSMPLLELARILPSTAFSSAEMATLFTAARFDQKYQLQLLANMAEGNLAYLVKEIFGLQV
eukprot:6799078-Pyramimonas_sp.AAC.1